MQGVENKTIEQKIDKNKDYITDEVEIKNFLLEDENQSQNIQELGNYLNNLQDKEYNEIKQNLEYIMTDPKIVEMFDGIRTKVGKNEKLTDDELSILYIFAVLYGKSDGFTNEGKFDLSLPIEKICNGKLLIYIQRKYQNLNYKPNYKDEGNNLTHIHKKSKNEADPWIMNKEEIDEGIKKIEREYKGLPQIPNIVDKGFIRPYCDKILKRADENGYLMKAEHESRLRNEYRTHVEYSYDEETGDVETERVYNKEFEAYVQYEKLLYAFTKYCEVINNKHEELVKKAGFFDIKEFSEEVKFLEDSQEVLKDKYPGLESAMERLKPYFEEIEENKNRWFPGKTDEEIEKAQKDFTEFKEFEAKKAKEDGITSETIKSISTQPESEIEVENYFKNLFKFWKYQNELNEEELKYGDNIENCQGYIEGIKIIEDKNKQSDFEMINKYMNDLNTSTYLYRPKGQEVGTSKGRLNIMDKFNKYSELLSNDPILKKDLHNISIINEVLRDPTSQDFWIFDVKNEETEKKLKQESINNRWNELYQKHPGIYEYLNIGVAARNTFINFTIGTGTSLGAMICGIIRGKEHYQSALQRKQRRDSALSFGISTEQQKPIYDPETHSIKLNRKNGPYQVASSITNMFLLINGGGEIASKIGGKFANQIGLFGMSFIQQAGQSFGEAINSGLDVGGAFAYSMLSASVQSGLELISPNEILLGKGIGLGKQLVTSLCKDGNKEGIKLAGKYFLKTMFHEIAEENLQEGLQLAAGNLINMYFNNKRNTNFEADWNYKNFLATAIITTLTTGIATGASAGISSLRLLNSSQPQIMSWINGNPELYEDVMKVLNNTIAGNMEIPNIDIENLKLLRGRLEGINASQEITNQNNEEEHTDNQTENQENHEERIDNNINSKKEQIIESMGSTLHEEWRQSRLQSDGTYEPRIKTTTDQERINRHNGETQVDIANTSFENLPADRKYENLEAAKVAVNLVYDILAQGQEITPEIIENLSSIVHDERLKRNGWAKGGELDVPYSQLSEEEKAKDRRQIQQAIETVNQNITQSQETEEGQNKKKKRNKDYFNGQPHEFNVKNMQEITIENSQYMDNALENVVNETDKGKLQELINDIKNHIEKQYEQVTGEKLNLTDDQVWSILDAHSENGSLGKLKIPELYKKVRPLIETIADKNVRRFLLEFGFCGTQENIEISNQTRNQVNQEQETQQAIEQREDLNEGKTNVERLQELGIEIRDINHENINSLELDFNKLGKIKDLGVIIYQANIKNLNNMEGLDFDKLGKIRNFGIDINSGNIEKLNKMEIDFEKLGRIRDLGVEIDSGYGLLSGNIERLNNMEGLDFDKLGKLKDLGVKIYDQNIEILNKMEGLDFEKLGRIRDLGVEIDVGNVFLNDRGNIEELNSMELDFTILEELKGLGIVINEWNIKGFNDLGLTNEDIQFIKENHLTNYDEIKFTMTIKNNVNNETKNGYIKRKQEYLERNRTIPEEKFLELFGKEGKDNKREKGKYGKVEINQTDIGLCYVYTGLEVLKKSNCFNELIQTNLKETSDGKVWEVRLPMGDPNGMRIKVNINEIDQKFLRTDQKTGESREASINSQSEYLGFKILEIAFMKYCIINDYNLNNKKIDSNVVEKAKQEYESTGIINFNEELIEYVEGSFVYNLFNIMLGSNFIYITNDVYEWSIGVSDQAKDLAFKYFSTGSIQITIGLPSSTEFVEELSENTEIMGDGKNYGIIVHNVRIINQAGYDFEAAFKITPESVEDLRINEKGEYIGNNKMEGDLVTDEDGNTVVRFIPGHAYSIERCYTDKNTGEKRVWVINPRHTGMKFDISLEQAKSIFNWNVTGIDIDGMFRQDIGENGVNQSIDQSNESAITYLKENSLSNDDINNLISYGININEQCIQELIVYFKKMNFSYFRIGKFCSQDTYGKMLTTDECLNRTSFIRMQIAKRGYNYENISRLIDIYNYMYDCYDHLIEDSKKNSQEVSVNIFSRLGILNELCSFGYVPDGKGKLVPNAELNEKIKTVENGDKILTPEDIDIMHQMVNIGNHKSFWENLKPGEFIETYLKLKDLFIPHLSTKNNTSKYTDPISKTEGEEFISKIIDQIEKKNISKAEKYAIDNYVGHSYETGINTEIEKRIEGGKNPNMNGLTADLINAINLYNLIERNEINEPMKLNRVERSGGDRITNTVKLHDGTTLKTILNNFDQYIDKVNEINEELKNITLKNNKFMSTSFGHDYNYFNNEGLGWDIYLQEGSHVILTNVYANAGAGNSELEYIVQAGSEIVFQIEVKNGWRPQLVGYVKTP